MQAGAAGSAAGIVDAGGLTEQGNLAHRTTRTAILGIVIGMTRKIARFTAEM